MKWTDLITPVIIVAFIVYASIMLWLINSKEAPIQQPIKIIERPYKLPAQINTIRDTIINTIRLYEESKDDTIAPYVGNDSIWSSEKQRAYWSRITE